MAMTFKAAAPLDAEAVLPMALLMQHLKDPEDEPLVIAAARSGALGWIEKRVGVSLTRRAWKATFSGISREDRVLRLPMAAAAVTAVTYVDDAGVSRVWPAESWRFSGGCLRMASGLSWLSAFADMPLTVEYDAGYEDVASEEPALLTAALMLAGHFYRNREENAAAVLASMPFGVSLLIEDIRLPVLR